MQKRSPAVRRVRIPRRLPGLFMPLRPPPSGLPVRWGHASQDDAPITALHRHEVLELGYCFAGTGVFVVEGKVMPFRASCATAINQREHHLARSAPGTESRWMWILFEPRELIGDPRAGAEVLDASRLSGPRFTNVLDPASQPDACAAIRELADELGADRRGRADAVRALAWTALTRLHRLPSGPHRPEDAGAMERIAPALNVIGRDFARPLTLAQLARACRTSDLGLRRLFQRALGQPPKRYLLRYRVQQAAAALRADLTRPVTDVAFSCGFESLSAFNRHFRAELGAPPRAWRRH